MNFSTVKKLQKLKTISTIVVKIDFFPWVLFSSIYIFPTFFSMWLQDMIFTFTLASLLGTIRREVTSVCIGHGLIGYVIYCAYL